jgi:hypothetical protein
VLPASAASTASPDLEQLAVGLTSMRQSMDQLAAQLTAGQQQMAGEVAKVQADVAKLQADEQKILQKLSAAAPRPPAAPARKLAPVTPPPAPSAEAR